MAKRYYWKNTFKMRLVAFILFFLIEYFLLGLRYSVGILWRLNLWIGFVCILTYTYQIFFGYVFLDEESLKYHIPLFIKLEIAWENLDSVQLSGSCDNPDRVLKWIFGSPFLSVWVYHKNGKHIPIANSMNDYIELLERLIDECDKRGLGGKVDYKIREKLWEYQDAKREEEEWEDEEWGEEDDE